MITSGSIHVTHGTSPGRGRRSLSPDRTSASFKTRNLLGIEEANENLDNLHNDESAPGESWRGTASVVVLLVVVMAIALVVWVYNKSKQTDENSEV